MKKSILFVESPLQLVNAYEAVNFFGLNNYSYIVRLSGSETNDNQMENIVKRLGINNVTYLKINAENRTVSDYLHLFFYKYKYLVTSKQIDKVFIGNLESGFFSLILKQFSKEKVILLDDGGKTMDIQNNFDDEWYYDLFTIYDLVPIQKQMVYKNNFTSILESLKNNNLIFNENEVLFIGSKLSECKIVDEKYYLLLMNEISFFYKNQTIIYIPHREESQSKLEKIDLIKNVQVKKIAYPVELLGLYENRMPIKVSSFFSTALITMKRIYNIDVESFSFDYRHVKNKQAMDDTYDYYRHEMNVFCLSQNV